MKKLKVLSVIGISAFALFSFTKIVQEKWEVPVKFKSMKNPTDPKDKENAAEGKALFSKNCTSCHGKKGQGDGSKAPELKGDLGDFTLSDFQKQTDGELFYKISEGRKDMPTFKKKMPNEEDRWLVINYVRTLKK